MQPRSALFDRTIANAHDLLVRADILAQGTVIATGLPVAGGSGSASRSQFARRTCSVLIGDPTYRPAGLPADLLAPYGNEIRLWRGAVTPAGPELIPLGTFGIRSADDDTGGDFKGITVTGIDRSKIVSESRFPWPRNSNDSSTSALGLIVNLISEVVPFAEVRVMPGCWDLDVPPVTWQSNRDAAITDLAASLGVEVFCDPYGAFVIQPIPNPAGKPVYTVAAGSGGVLVSARRSLSRDGVHNGVIARGTTTATTSTPVVSDLITDDDPNSPTYWYGKFNQIVGFYDSSLIVAKDQANNAAQALLLNQIGAARSIDYVQAVQPALEPGDVIAVVDEVTGVTERHLIEQLTIPLDAAGTMTGQTRSHSGTTWPQIPQWAAAGLS